MKKGPLYAVIGTLLYAGANVLIEHKFAKLSNLTVVLGYSLVVAGLAFAVRAFAMKNGDPAEYAFPSGYGLFLLLALGVIFFLADYFYIGAYTSGTSMTVITCIYILFPVFAALIKLVGSQFIPGMSYTPPNLYIVLAYILGCASVLLALKGGAMS